jgi:hypothetical protein
MIVYINPLVIDNIWYVVKFVMGMCKSEVFLVLILCSCELDINCSLFLASNNITESVYSNLPGFIKEINFYNILKQELK